MKKICTVVGARPQFIKLAVVSRALRQKFDEVIIHTGQHYDYNMSDVFFKELEIEPPTYNLGIKNLSHGEMTGQMLIEIEKTLMKEKPDMLVVFGDTNSTMAGALAAVKLQIPVCHVEAGCRVAALSNPEEVNRIVTDHVSSLHLVCTDSGVEYLKKEGITKSVHLVGDPMYDAFVYYSSRLDGAELNELKSFNDKPIALPEAFYYMTCHRQENTDTDEKLKQIFLAMEELDSPVIYPVHPRNQERAKRLCDKNRCKNIILARPVGYKTSISLVNKAKKVITDSGGLQREAFFAKKQCVTVFYNGCWPETTKNGCNRWVYPDKNDILEKLFMPCSFEADYLPFGDGHASQKIARKIEDFFEANKEGTL